MIQYYNWEWFENTNVVSFDQWGNIVITGTDTVTIYGTYKLNSSFRIKYVINIVEISD